MKLDEIMKLQYKTMFARSLEQLAQYLVNHPDSLESFSDLDIYDKIKDIDWHEAIYARYIMEESCLEITYVKKETD